MIGSDPFLLLPLVHLLFRDGTVDSSGIGLQIPLVLLLAHGILPTGFRRSSGPLITSAGRSPAALDSRSNPAIPEKDFNEDPF